MLKGLLGENRTPSRSRAALGYFFYGVVYLVGAMMELDPSRKIIFWGFVPWWSFYIAGALVMVTIPIFVARGVIWLTWIIAFFVAGKAGWLVWMQGRSFQQNASVDSYNTFFALVAGVAAMLLFHAALEGRRRSP
jgi:hypothetical protein